MQSVILPRRQLEHDVVKRPIPSEMTCPTVWPHPSVTPGGAMLTSSVLSMRLQPSRCALIAAAERVRISTSAEMALSETVVALSSMDPRPVTESVVDSPWYAVSTAVSCATTAFTTSMSDEPVDWGARSAPSASRRWVGVPPLSRRPPVAPVDWGARLISSDCGATLVFARSRWAGISVYPVVISSFI